MKVVMVVAQQGFRDEEFSKPRSALEGAGHTVVVASEDVGLCTGINGATVMATVALKDVAPEAFEGVVFVGGPGARALFDDKSAHHLAVEMSRAGKLVGAICVAPVILARAGVLAGGERLSSHRNGRRSWQRERSSSARRWWSTGSSSPPVAHDTHASLARGWSRFWRTTGAPKAGPSSGLLQGITDCLAHKGRSVSQTRISQANKNQSGKQESVRQTRICSFSV